jgi:hypothetical protein
VDDVVSAAVGIAASTPLLVEVVQDRVQLEALSVELDELTHRCALPVTARSPWTRAALDAVPAAEPLAVLVRDGGGALRAAAVLLVLPGPGTDTVVLPSGLDHRGGLPAEDVWAAAALSDALADVLRCRPRPTLVRLGPVSVHSPALTSLQAALPGAKLVLAHPIPVVQRDGSTDAQDYLFHGIRRGLRRASNRLAGDGRSVDIAFTSNAGDIARMAPAMEGASRERDHAHGRTSPLDDSVGRLLWHRRLQYLLASGFVELATLHIDGCFAAYVLGLTDYPDYRVLEGRFVGEFARYSPGRMLEAAVVQRVMSDPDFERLDWMTATAPETLLATNASDDVVVLQAELSAGRPHRGPSPLTRGAGRPRHRRTSAGGHARGVAQGFAQ